MSGKQRKSLTVDEREAQWWEEQDNASAELRRLIRQDAAERSEYPGLSDEQETAYEWMLETWGVGQRVRMDALKPAMAQRLSKDMNVVTDTVIKPLAQNGYLGLHQGIRSVTLTVQEPPESTEGTQ